MNLTMKHEYFTDPDPIHTITENASCVPPKLYPQDTDWTCSLACIKSITSGIINFSNDDTLIKQYNLKPGPKYSSLIKELGMLNNDKLDVIYGCDIESNNKDISVLWNLLHNQYRVMINWMMSYDHWTVLLNYIQSGLTNDTDYDIVTYYDPYCNEVKSIRVAHLSVMWLNGDKTNVKDFIAIKQKNY